MIKTKFLKITPRTEHSFNVIFLAEDGQYLYTVDKWIYTMDDVNNHISLDNGLFVNLNNSGTYFISDEQRMLSVNACFNYNAPSELKKEVIHVMQKIEITYNSEESRLECLERIQGKGTNWIAFSQGMLTDEVKKYSARKTDCIRIYNYN